jgi:hypothetical protein
MAEKRIAPQPGPVPDIRIEANCVTYVIEIRGQIERLLIRCSPDGAIQASIIQAAQP